MEKISVKKLEPKVEKHINALIRQRTLDEQPLSWGGDFFICCSCGKQKSKAVLQAGHFVSVRKSSMLRFHPWNIHGECAGCNCLDKDHLIGYGEFMRARYGAGIIGKLTAIKNLGSREYKQGVKPYLDKMLTWGLEEIFDRVFKRYHG